MRSGPIPHLRMLHSAKQHKSIYLLSDFAIALTLNKEMREAEGIRSNTDSVLNTVLYLVLAAILILAVGLRWRFIQTVQLYPDEFVTLLAVRQITEIGRPILPSGLFYDHGLLFSYFGSLAAILGPARPAVVVVEPATRSCWRRWPGSCRHSASPAPARSR